MAGISDADQSRLSVPGQHSRGTIILDLVLFMDLAQRVGMGGIQEWLSFYFKSPMHKKICIRNMIFSFSDEAQEYPSLSHVARNKSLISAWITT